MKKTFKIYGICWAILLVAFHLVAFLTPKAMAGTDKFSGGFWVGYALTTLAFVGQFICAYFAFQQKNRRKFFYSVSTITISYTATILSVIVGAVCIFVPFIPVWVGGIVSVLILAFSAVSVLKAHAVAEIVGEREEAIKSQTFFLQSLTAKTETLMAKTKSEPIGIVLKKVYEAVRYSDPMSKEALSGIEAQITLKFDALCKAVETENTDAVKSEAEELLILVNDRNKTCRLLK